ncbi:hypothetical protein [Xanthomonas campestris]|uniref:hypothetical protein n=1 Tax=Xanthomonas campestris TaxID=339 RepID=UPI00388E800F
MCEVDSGRDQGKLMENLSKSAQWSRSFDLFHTRAMVCSVLRMYGTFAPRRDRPRQVRTLRNRCQVQLHAIQVGVAAGIALAQPQKKAASLAGSGLAGPLEQTGKTRMTRWA